MIYYRNKLFLHAIHLSKLQFKIYFAGVMADSLFRLLTLRLYYVKAIMLFLKEKHTCIESKQRFEGLARRVGTNLSVKAVVAKILRSLENTRVEYF